MQMIDRGSLQSKPTEIISTNSYPGSDTPPDDKPDSPRGYWERLTTVVESVSWQLLYASNEVIGYKLLLTLQEDSLSPQPFSWVPVVTTVVVGWLTRSYWDPEAPIFNQLDEQVIHANHELQIITLPGGGGASSTTHKISDASSSSSTCQKSSGNFHCQSIATSNNDDTSGNGGDEPHEPWHSRSETIRCPACNGPCELRPKEAQLPSATNCVTSVPGDQSESPETQLLDNRLKGFRIIPTPKDNLCWLHAIHMSVGNAQDLVNNLITRIDSENEKSGFVESWRLHHGSEAVRLVRSQLLTGDWPDLDILLPLISYLLNRTVVIVNLQASGIAQDQIFSYANPGDLGITITAVAPALPTNQGQMNVYLGLLHQENHYVSIQPDTTDALSSCPVCLESVSESTEIKSTTCYHYFCEECFNELSSGYSWNCPICRTEQPGNHPDHGGLTNHPRTGGQESSSHSVSVPAERTHTGEESYLYLYQYCCCERSFQSRNRNRCERIYTREISRPTIPVHSYGKYCFEPCCFRRGHCILALSLATSQHKDTCRCQACMANLGVYAHPPPISTQCDSISDGSIACSSTNHPRTGVQESNSHSVSVPAERTHTGEKRYPCQYCEQSFSQLGIRKKLKRAHTGEKLYSCLYCEQSFSRASIRNGHERAHTGGKPYLCQYCEQSFSRSNIRNEHERAHTGVKPYPCQYCERSFNLASIRSEHERAHTGGKKPYLCQYCGLYFTQSGNRDQHERTHTREMPYSWRLRLEIENDNAANDSPGE